VNWHVVVGWVVVGWEEWKEAWDTPSGAQPRTEKASRVARLDESGYQGRTRHELCSRSAVESSPKNRGPKEEERAKGQGTQDEKTELEDGEQGSSEETGWTAGQRQKEACSKLALAVREDGEGGVECP
jgi:hypothetical protein